MSNRVTAPNNGHLLGAHHDKKRPIGAYHDKKRPIGTEIKSQFKRLTKIKVSKDQRFISRLDKVLGGKNGSGRLVFDIDLKNAHVFEVTLGKERHVVDLSKLKAANPESKGRLILTISKTDGSDGKSYALSAKADLNTASDGIRRFKTEQTSDDTNQAKPNTLSFSGTGQVKGANNPKNTGASADAYLAHYQKHNPTPTFASRSRKAVKAARDRLTAWIKKLDPKPVAQRLHEILPKPKSGANKERTPAKRKILVIKPAESSRSIRSVVSENTPSTKETATNAPQPVPVEQPKTPPQPKSEAKAQSPTPDKSEATPKASKSTAHSDQSDATAESKLTATETATKAPQTKSEAKAKPAIPDKSDTTAESELTPKKMDTQPTASDNTQQTPEPSTQENQPDKPKAIDTTPPEATLNKETEIVDDSHANPMERSSSVTKTATDSDDLSIDEGTATDNPMTAQDQWNILTAEIRESLLETKLDLQLPQTLSRLDDISQRMSETKNRLNERASVLPNDSDVHEQHKPLESMIDSILDNIEAKSQAIAALKIERSQVDETTATPVEHSSPTNEADPDSPSIDQNIPSDNPMTAQDLENILDSEMEPLMKEMAIYQQDPENVSQGEKLLDCMLQTRIRVHEHAPLFNNGPDALKQIHKERLSVIDSTLNKILPKLEDVSRIDTLRNQILPKIEKALALATTAQPKEEATNSKSPTEITDSTNDQEPKPQKSVDPKTGLTILQSASDWDVKGNLPPQMPDWDD